MQRLSALMIAAAMVAGSALAGSIQTQIGGTTGLTGAYIGSANLGGYTEQNYDSYLFSGVPASLGTNYSNTVAQLSTLTDGPDGGITFAMVDDGCGGTPAGACSGGALTNNVWVAPQSGGPATITIPIGIFDVTNVWTLLADDLAQAAAQNTTIEFDFGSTATTANGTQLILNLVDSSNNGVGLTGQIRTAMSTTAGTCASCAGLSKGTTANPSIINGVTVNTQRVQSFAYNSAQAPTSGPYLGSTAGSVFLSDEGFSLGSAYQGVYLVDIKVTDNNAAAGVSQDDLSAITVVSNTVSSTPEPSSVWLGLTGLVALGAFVLRRRVVSA